MTTSASPTAATATIDARTATCEMLSTVRNCGAASDTSAPSTSMIATRLSSRCRPTTPSQAPRSRAAWRGALTPASAMRVAGICREIAGRGDHDPFLGRVGARDLGRDSPFVEDEDPVRHRQDFGQVARDEDDPKTRGRELGDDPVDLDLGADVDATRRLVEDEQQGF